MPARVNDHTLRLHPGLFCQGAAVDKEDVSARSLYGAKGGENQKRLCSVQQSYPSSTLTDLLFLSVYFFVVVTNMSWKGSFLKHSSAFLWCSSWFWFLSLLAHSFTLPLSQLFFFGWWIAKQQECFLSPCGLARNICFQFDRFLSRNSWERKWWLHDGSKMSFFCLKNISTYPSVSPFSPHFSLLWSPSLPSPPLLFALLV